MGEIVFQALQLGQQSAIATAVAATTLYPCDSGVAIDLDRGFNSPDEDYGVLARHQPGRASYGLRGAMLSVPSVARFEDLGHWLQARLGAPTITGIGPYTQTFLADQTSVSTKAYTAELLEAEQDYRAIGCVVTDLEIGFDALSAPGETPWRVTATLEAINRDDTTATAAISAPATLETIEGHLARIYEGTTATAFGSLAELANHLIAYTLRISGGRPKRPYGSANDYASSVGILKPDITFTSQIKKSATSKTNIEEIFDASGAVAGERRWRIDTAGSGTKKFTIDGRVRFESVNEGERDGEKVYDVAGHYVYDATLGSSLQAVIAGIANATIP